MAFVYRALVTPLASPLPISILALLSDYRVLTNEILRESLRTGHTSIGSLDRFARDRALHHRLTCDHAVAAASIALSLARTHRRRLRQGKTSTPPWIRQAFLRTGTKTFHLDRETGLVRLSLRRCVWASFTLELSSYHRTRLCAPNVVLKQLHLTERSAVLIFETPIPDLYRPSALIALDTNERSLDGVTVSRSALTPARVRFEEISVIQHRHFERRRQLGKKKATDRRVARRLLSREGRRERNRVRARIHNLTRKLVEVAARYRAALVLEDLSGLSAPRRRDTARKKPRSGHSQLANRPAGFTQPRRARRFSARFRRRMTAWPRGELHRQLAYKAAERGVTVYWVNPFRTSVTCPRCGGLTYPRSRVRPKFTCASCGWSLDRQINAGVNLAKTVLRDYGRTELGGLRLDLDALSHEVVRPRYPFAKSKGQGRSVRRGRELGASGPPGGPRLVTRSQPKIEAVRPPYSPVVRNR